MTENAGGKGMEQSLNDVKTRAIEGMKDYFASERFIAHTLKVLEQAERIFEGEGVVGDFLRSTVVLGSIYHDIGIPEAVKKHSSMDAPYQEMEGPPVARELMRRIGVRPDILERVCRIVGAHHTREKVDGIDFQIIWEADFIVNVDEKNIVLKKEELRKSLEANTVTPTGRRLASQVIQRVHPGP
jgi:hypothetical protein